MPIEPSVINSRAFKSVVVNLYAAHAGLWCYPVYQKVPLSAPILSFRLGLGCMDGAFFVRVDLRRRSEAHTNGEPRPVFEWLVYIAYHRLETGSRQSCCPTLPPLVGDSVTCSPLGVLTPVSLLVVEEGGVIVLFRTCPIPGTRKPYHISPPPLPLPLDVLHVHIYTKSHVLERGTSLLP